jgi:hypothetical protein
MGDRGHYYHYGRANYCCHPTSDPPAIVLDGRVPAAAAVRPSPRLAGPRCCPFCAHCKTDWATARPQLLPLLWTRLSSHPRDQTQADQPPPARTLLFSLSARHHYPLSVHPSQDQEAPDPIVPRVYTARSTTPNPCISSTSHTGQSPGSSTRINTSTAITSSYHKHPCRKSPAEKAVCSAEHALSK